MAETVSTSAMAAAVGVSHTTLLRHVEHGIVQPDTDNRRFYRDSADRVRRQLAINRTRQWRHVPNL